MSEELASRSNPYAEHLRIYLDSSDLAEFSTLSEEELQQWGRLFEESKAMLLISLPHLAELSHAPASVAQGVAKLIQIVPGFLPLVRPGELVFRDFKEALCIRLGLIPSDLGVSLERWTPDAFLDAVFHPPPQVEELRAFVRASNLPRLLVAQNSSAPVGPKKLREAVANTEVDVMRDFTNEMLVELVDNFPFKEHLLATYGKSPEDLYVLNNSPEEMDAIFNSMTICYRMLGLEMPKSRPSDFGVGLQSLMAAMLEGIRPQFEELQKLLCARSNVSTAEEFQKQAGFTRDSFVHRSRLCSELHLTHEEYRRLISSLKPEETPLSSTLSVFDYLADKSMKGRMPEEGDIFDQYHLEFGAFSHYLSVDKRTYSLLEIAYKSIKFDLSRFHKCGELASLRRFLLANPLSDPKGS